VLADPVNVNDPEAVAAAPALAEPLKLNAPVGTAVHAPEPPNVSEPLAVAGA
jgi:hypothetical protein